MPDQEPFRFKEQTPAARVAVVVCGVIATALAVAVLAVLAGLLVDAVRWAWS
jgi:hypothetical protein